jgi:hypothetical protein
MAAGNVDELEKQDYDEIFCQQKCFAHPVVAHESLHSLSTLYNQPA